MPNTLKPKPCPHSEEAARWLRAQTRRLRPALMLHAYAPRRRGPWPPKTPRPGPSDSPRPGPGLRDFSEREDV